MPVGSWHDPSCVAAPIAGSPLVENGNGWTRQRDISIDVSSRRLRRAGAWGGGATPMMGLASEWSFPIRARARLAN